MIPDNLWLGIRIGVVTSGEKAMGATRYRMYLYGILRREWEASLD